MQTNNESDMKLFRMAKPALAVLALLFANQVSAQSDGWWSDSWSFRKEIRVDVSPTAGDVAEDQVDVPVLLRLSVGNFAFFDDAAPDGSDVRFIAADDVTPLDFHIERWDAQYQLALVWVRIPRIPGGSNSAAFFMYYGNPEAQSGSDSTSVFDARQALVLQFSEEGTPLDQTAYGNNPTVATTTSIEGGLIAGAAAFDPASSIVVPASSSLTFDPANGFTLSMWVRPAGTQTDGATLATVVDPATGDEFRLELVEGAPAATLVSGGVESTALSPSSLTDAVWHHVAVSADATTLSLVLDGYVVATADISPAALNGDLVLGAPPFGVAGFAGEVDQVEFSGAVRSEGRLRFAARNEAQFSNVLVYGADNSNADEGGHPNYVLTTIRNVKGGFEQFIIVILMIMAVLSWIVMFLKGQLLTRIERQNTHFLQEYTKLTGDPLALDQDAPEIDSMEEEGLLTSSLEDPDSYHPSTVFPLYHVGAAEVKKRLALRSPAAGAAPAKFTAETIGAISASIDAALVRQRQKLNRLMVLLTIAISGGPFLGLLGTVVGVMITFAAIAASGDVNVNSIAPGIAAALVATVAGLIVAIPALFGYNWLGSRIKDIDANTQVFADEFINKIAEHYA